MTKKHTSELEEHLGYWLRCLSNVVHHSFAAKLADYDISVAGWVVLRTLFDSEHLTLIQTAEKVGVDKSTLSRMVERLVQHGWVQREEGGNRRSVHLGLTPLGRKLVPKLAALADDNDEAFFKTLTAEQKETFLALTKQVLSANGWEAHKRGDDRME